MSKAQPYAPPVDQLLTLGDPREGEEAVQPPRQWRDYRSLGLSEDDIPELVRLACDKRLHRTAGDRPEVWAGLHAWRTLGQLGADEAGAPLLDLLNFLAETEEDWGLEEVPLVLAMIGPASIEPARQFLGDARKRLWARVGAATALREVAQRHPASRDLCTRHLAACLENARWNDPTLNGFLVAGLLETGAADASGVIEQAFQKGCVDPSVAGDWEYVREQMERM